MDFTAFDSSKLEVYSRKAKEQWGQTAAYKEYEEKSKNWTKEDRSNMMADFSKLFEEFGTMKDMDPASAEVQAQVKRVQDFITENMNSDIAKQFYDGNAEHDMYIGEVVDIIK